MAEYAIVMMGPNFPFYFHSNAIVDFICFYELLEPAKVCHTNLGRFE